MFREHNMVDLGGKKNDTQTLYFCKNRTVFL